MHHEDEAVMAEVFLRQNQIAGFLRTTTCTMDMVEVFLRQTQSAGFLSIPNLVEVFLRQIAGFLTTTNRASRTWLRFSSGRVPVSSTPQYEYHDMSTTKTVEGFLRQIAGSLRPQHHEPIEDYEAISKLKTCDSGESSGTREARYTPGVVRPMGSVLPLSGNR